MYREHETSESYVNPTSLVHLVVGMAGNIEGHQGHHWAPAPQPEWYAFRDGEHFGFTTMNIMNATHLSWQYHDAASEEVLDEFVLIKEQHMAL